MLVLSFPYRLFHRLPLLIFPPLPLGTLPLLEGSSFLPFFPDFFISDLSRGPFRNACPLERLSVVAQPKGTGEDKEG